MTSNDSTVQQFNDSTESVQSFSGSTDIRPVDFSTASDVVIRVDNLSKKYIIGHQRAERYQTFRDNLSAGTKNFARKLLHPFNSSTIQQFNDSTEEFYALKDVSFEVKRGDRVGIIGRNGAGKSTLLKILSRITEPTSGRIEIDGRVASLLEVGTGFHPELTGRENIFLNGAILGMTREEIRRKFDEIVAFAEIEKFLDTPVKRYSSGMYVRLAFAVAAHLEPEILIVDEVLAVGDAQFQKKCLGKMEEVGREGRTVLFVSHNMSAITDLCDNTILLEHGKLIKFSDTNSVVPLYLRSNSSSDYKGININTYVDGGGAWQKGKKVAVEIVWEKYRFAPGWECDLACYTMEGSKVFAIESQKIDGFDSSNNEINCLIFFIENVGFSENILRVDVGIRKSPRENYNIIISDALLLNPEASSVGKHRRNDVIVVPDVSCVLGEK